MEYRKYISQEHDKRLQEIRGIKYLPWIGKDLRNQEEKIMIIGESVYNWGKTDV